ncbi:MAG TPA: hypothetical protein VFG33_39155 [Kribbella sp.]|uniref:hypothetical protein n=1 Tax=Kribbella sp. TaxID=1871183 RepID=UPI002D78CB9F|nr:hypothetical protein [Kribbella sp.]HET6299450.1 hypothetical protein [Kribbella sp.]
MRSHYPACERAEQNLCRCQQCGGMMHRIEWALAAAQQASGEDRRRRRRSLDAAWERFDEDRRATPAVVAQVAVNSGFVDVVDWLAEDYRPAVVAGEEDRSVVAHLRAGLVGLVSDAVRIEMDAIVGLPGTDGHVNPLRLGLADHFWCDLFAAIAQVARDVQAELDQVPDHLAGVIIHSRRADNNLVRPKRGARRPTKRIRLEDVIVERVIAAAVETAWAPVQALYQAKLQLLIRHAQILAILICPAPERHRSVVEHCMRPLFGEEIADPTVERIKAALYGDLFAPVVEGTP